MIDSNAGVSKEGFVEEFKRAISVLFLKIPEIKSVSESNKSDVYGAIIFLLPLVLNFLFTFFGGMRFYSFGFPFFVAIIFLGSFALTLKFIVVFSDKVFKEWRNCE